MKNNKNFLKKLTAGILGFVMTLGVGAAGFAASASETRAATQKTTTMTWGGTTNQFTFSDSGDTYLEWTHAGGSSSPIQSADFRMYAGVSLTVKAKSSYANSVTIKSLSITGASSKNSNSLFYNASTGAIVTSGTELSWTTSSSTKTATFNDGLNSVSVSRVNSGNQVRVTKVEVTYYVTESKSLTSIAVSNSHRSFSVGDTFEKETVTATYSDSSTADVTSSADFSGYNMNAAGTQTVTVSYGGKTTTYQITVSNVAVSSISLDKTSTEISIGKTDTLSVIFNPANATNKNVTWTSSKESVATVAEGVVTGVSVGTAIITATSVDGNKTATCSVTVNAGPTEETIDFTKLFSSGSGYKSGSTTVSSDLGNDVSISYTNVLSGNLQVQAGTSNNFKSTTTLRDYISYIKITKGTNNFTYNLSTDGSNWTNSVTASSDVELNLSEEDGYKYFKVNATGSYTKVSEVIVTYKSAAVVADSISIESGQSLSLYSGQSDDSILYSATGKGTLGSAKVSGEVDVATISFDEENNKVIVAAKDNVTGTATYKLTKGDAESENTFTVTVSERTLKSVSIIGDMSTKEYGKGTNWNLAGLSLQAIYSVGDPAGLGNVQDLIDSGDLTCTLSPAIATLGTTSLVISDISYGGVNGTDKTITGIVVLDVALIDSGMQNFDYNGYDTSKVYTDKTLKPQGTSYEYMLNSFEHYNSSGHQTVLGDYGTSNGTWDNFSSLDNFGAIANAIIDLQLKGNNNRFDAIVCKNFAIKDFSKAEIAYAYGTGSEGNSPKLYLLGSKDNGVSWLNLANGDVNYHASGSFSWTDTTSKFGENDDVLIALVYISDGTGSSTSASPGVRNVSWKFYGDQVVTDVTWKPYKLAMKQSSNLKVGEVETLTFTSSPLFASDTYTWSSDNESVATVDSGVVTAVGAGEANITVTSSAGVSSTCKFTVVPADYTIKYLAGDGTGDPVTETKAYNEGTKAKDGSIFTAPIGREFDCWSGGGKTYAAGDDIPAQTGGSTLELTAVYKYIEYTITYVLKGGTNASTNPSKYKYNDSTITLAEPSKEGNSFTGWTDENGQAITQIASGSTGNKTLTANWEVDSYNVEFNGTNVTWDKDSTTISCEYGSTVTATLSVSEEFHLPGSVSVMCGEEAVTCLYDNSTGELSFTMPAGKVTIVAIASADATISYAEKDGTAITGDYLVKSYREGVGVTLVNAHNKTGYTFVGWYDNAQLSGSPVTVVSTTARGNLTFYAKWAYAGQDALDCVSTSLGVSYTYTKDGGSPVVSKAVSNEATYHYELVIENQADWSGEYLLVGQNNTSKKYYALAGSQTSASTGKGTIPVQQVFPDSETDIIESSTTVDPCAITFSKNSNGFYAIKCGDYYVGANTDENNELYTSTDASTYQQELVFDSDTYKVAIKNVFGNNEHGSDKSKLQMLNSNGSEVFKFYKGTQLDCWLYKKVYDTPPGPTYTSTFKFSVKNTGMSSLIDMYRGVYDDMGIAVSYNDRVRYFSFIKAEDGKYYIHEADKPDVAFSFNKDGSSFTLNLGDILNNIDNAEVEFTVQAYIHENNQYHLSENSTTYSLIGWIDEYYSDSRYTAAVKEIHDILHELLGE